MITNPVFPDARILVVDDEPDNVALLQYLLNCSGYKAVRATTDPRQAMALFDEYRPDLVLLDLMMPHLDGYEIMRLIGERVPSNENLPILVLTANAGLEIKHRALEAGASDFLTKPFDHFEALLRIRHLLQCRAQHQQLARQKEILEDTVAVRTDELRRTCGRLEEALGELRQTQHQMIQHERMSALGTMAAGLAHDFNNSLSLILGYSELLQTELTDTPYEEHSDEFLGTIITAAQDASKMFNRLRTFYRAQDDEEDHRAGFDFNAMVEQTAALTRPRWHGQALARGAEIRLVHDLAPGLPSLFADAAELRDMLTNLIFNAVDAMPQGGMLTLRTRHDPTDGGALVLTVEDTGLGMSEETRCHCLEPFYTTKGDQGTGLGLAMVFGTVQRHKGSIELRSAVGQGTSISLRLPLHRSVEDVPSPAPAPTVEMPLLRVLVVDDQPILARILHRYLTEDGHTVEMATGGQEALDKLRAAAGPNGFQLVITDKGMPGLCGEQLAAEVKRFAPKVRTILVSGYGDLEAATRHPSIDLALSKPLTHEALRTAVRRVMAATALVPLAAVAEGRRTRLLPALRPSQSSLRLTTHQAA